MDLEASDVVISLTHCAMTHEINQELEERGKVKMIMRIMMVMTVNRCCMSASRTRPATDWKTRGSCCPWSRRAVQSYSSWQILGRVKRIT